jgi:outer membrane protein OmpA-like peptidoglycan-associated protein
VTEGGKVLSHLQLELGASFNYERRPAQILRKSDGARVTDTISHKHILSLCSHIGLWNRLELGFAIPFELSQRTTGLQYMGENHTTEIDSGLGDIILFPKIRLFSLGDKTLFHIGLVGPIELPTSTYNSLIGYNAPSFSPQLMLELDTEYFDAALNIGYSFRLDNSLAFRSQNVSMDDALIGSLGMKVAVWKNTMELVGDSYFTMGINEQDEEEIPVEVLGGLRLYLPGGFQIDVGGGAGLTKGVGAPTFRIMAGIGWGPEEPKTRVITETIYKEKDCPDCPPIVKPVVVEKTLIIPHVYFDTDKYYLRPDAVVTLDKTIDLLKKNTWITKVRLEGHCDHRMSNEYNEHLAWNRVNAVRDYLVKNGVKLERLESRSYGETQRVDTTKTVEGMQKNRRVEFHILKVNR